MKTLTVTKLESNKALHDDKKTIIKDENGYYKIALGAFNTYNASGIFYRLKDPSILLRDKTILNRRVTTGELRAEEEHPDFKHMSREEIITRTIKLDLTRVCAHIKAVEFVDLGRCEPGWEGHNIHIVYGWVLPSGPFGDSLAKSLENPDENVAFSVRSLVRQKTIGATIVRDVLDVSTWDHVYEPGIKIATQWFAAGIEHRSEDIGICIDGVCSTKLKNVMASSEDISCEDGECLLNTVDKIGDIPKLLNW